MKAIMIASLSVLLTVAVGCSNLRNDSAQSGDSYYCQAEGAGGHICRMDYYSIISDPRTYDRKLVAVLVYIARVSDGYLLFPDETRARSMFMASASILNDDNVSLKLDSIEELSSSGVYAEITGNFFADKYSSKNGGVFVGRMEGIERITLLRDRDDQSFTFYGDVVYVKPN